MINVKINETTLLNLFMNRLEYWTTDADVLELYAKIDVDMFLDNVCINNTAIMDKKELLETYIDIYVCHKVLTKNEDKDLYLVRNY